MAYNNRATHSIDGSDDDDDYSTTTTTSSSSRSSPSLSDVNYRNSLKKSIGEPVAEKKSSGGLSLSTLMSSSEMKRSSSNTSSSDLKNSGAYTGLRKSSNSYKRSHDEDDIQEVESSSSANATPMKKSTGIVGFFQSIKDVILDEFSEDNMFGSSDSVKKPEP
eukprot:TRINITY_DN3354_c0_g1_i1.p1 TRINITY_DN3354_c0_g1~~TRINITY_DN3354_c0_g1_i1.p1  ORF type:complete len:163 (+),score=48.11 TRINITY_DN3354_c0_g1_i1:63-551(+)